MRRNIFIVLVIALMPALSYAYSIESVSVSSSDTGGVSAGSGETVVSGPSNVSSEVRTFITGGSTGGTADVQISTDLNGVRRTETRHYDIPQGGSAVIDAATSSRIEARAATGSVRTDVRVGSSSRAEPIFTILTSATSTANVQAPASSTLLTLLSGFSAFFGSFFGRALFFLPFHTN